MLGARFPPTPGGPLDGRAFANSPQIQPRAHSLSAERSTTPKSSFLAAVYSVVVRRLV